MLNEIEFKLSQPIFYAKEGHSTETSTLILYPPSAKQIGLSARIKKSVICAFVSPAQGTSVSADKDNSDDDSVMTASALINFLYTKPSIDVAELFCSFRELLLTGCCVISPITPNFKQFLTAPLYDDLSAEDIERMLGEYLLNFLVFSILQNKK